MPLDDWFLSADERGNPDSQIPTWCAGNTVEPLIHGKTYFDRLVTEVETLGDGDHLLRTCPAMRPPYGFARLGEQRIARGYTKAVRRARRLVPHETERLPGYQRFLAILAYRLIYDPDGAAVAGTPGRRPVVPGIPRE